jgi:5'-nucleotidase
VGQVSGHFARSGSRTDSPAGRLIADAQLAATRSAQTGAAQMAFMNPGGIRSDLECQGTPPCTVTFGQAFTMQPFGNSLVVMTLSGAQIKALLESQQKSSAAEPTFLQPSDGLTYTWQADAPAGERVRDLRLQGEALLPAQTYRVTVNSFLAEGGDGFMVLKEGTAQLGGGQDVDALVAYLSTSPPREPSTQARIAWAP